MAKVSRPLQMGGAAITTLIDGEIGIWHPFGGMAGTRPSKMLKSKKRSPCEYLMKKRPKVISRLELSHAYDEGKHAFEENMRRGHNPHVSTKQELAMAWWHGWDTAEEESTRNKQNRPARTSSKRREGNVVGGQPVNSGAATS